MGNSIFSYYISVNDAFIPELPRRETFGRYAVFTDGKTPFSVASNGDCQCAIFGLAVNVITGEDAELPELMLKNCASIETLIEYEKQLGGKYIILFRRGEQYYILGDATTSIPILYNIEGQFVCTSNPQYLLREKKYVADREYLRIRRSGDISQAMPFDITAYREIKQLIPNHYLEIDGRQAVRFVNSKQKQVPISVENATEIVSPMIDKLLQFYISRYKIYCPITAGRDSRVVLAFLMKSGADFRCYTIRHPHHRDDSQDLVIPAELCQRNELAYEQIADVEVSQELRKEADELFGERAYSLRTLQIAQTVKEYYGDGAILNGDIIGQVGKCSLHRDIPSFLATPGYFRCKLHNYSRGAKKQLKLWLKEIKASGESVNTFDLFSIENRLGRWAGQENLVYNSIGQVYLNIFNSRSIIYTWTAVKRSRRKRSLLHIALVEKINAALLEIPFEQETSFLVKLSKSSGLLYYTFSYLKYWSDKKKFQRRTSR